MREQELTNGLIKVIQGKQHKVYFVQGHGEKSDRRLGSRRLREHLPGADRGELHGRQAGARAAEGGPRRRVGAGDRRPEDRLLRARARDDQALPGARAARSSSCWTRPTRRAAPRSRRVIALLKEWAIERRQRHRGRRQRHGPASWHRPRGAGGRASTSRTRSPIASTCSPRTGSHGRSRRHPAAPAASSRRAWSRPVPRAGPKRTSRR